jgi:hypothetical protein
MIHANTLFLSLLAIANCQPAPASHAPTSHSTPATPPSASRAITAAANLRPLDPFIACRAIALDANDLYCITITHDPTTIALHIVFAPDAHLTVDAPLSAHLSGENRSFAPSSIHEQDLVIAARQVHAVSHIRRDAPERSRVNVTLDFYACTPTRCTHAQKSWQLDDP